MGANATVLSGELQVDYVDLLVADCPPELAPRGLSCRDRGGVLLLYFSL